jgi:hypothetical protein
MEILGGLEGGRGLSDMISALAIAECVSVETDVALTVLAVVEILAAAGTACSAGFATVGEGPAVAWAPLLISAPKSAPDELRSALAVWLNGRTLSDEESSSEFFPRSICA